jgi:hypothetical protein
MGSSYERLFKVLPQNSTPAYLCERICEAILRERAQHLLYWSTFRERSRLVLSSLTTAGSLVGLAFALPALAKAAVATGFSTFAGLALSDSDVLANHFSTFGLALLEAVPGFEVTLTLLLVAIFLVSIQNFVMVAFGPHSQSLFSKTNYV